MVLSREYNPDVYSILRLVFPSTAKFDDLGEDH